MKRSAVLWLVFILFMFARNSFAAGNVQSFKEANQVYADGKYQDAIKTYQEILKSSPSAEVYYNLASAFIKDKQLGNAVLNYERAKRLNPRDPDIRSNLSYMNRLIEYKVEDKRSWYFRTIMDLLGFFRPIECWLLFLGSYSIFLVGLLISMIRRRPLLNKFNTVLLSVVVIALLPLFLKYSETGMKNDAVVTAKQAEVRYGPSTVDRIAFRLVEGLKVSVHDHKQDWSRIKLIDGRTGWVRDSEISVI